MINRNSLKDKIYTEVFQSIIKGEYRPNDILSEKSLVEKYSVSKSPVREALIELCNEGVLRSIPRYGYEVIRLTDQDVEDIQQFRLVLECGCVVRYWDRLTSQHVEKLRSQLAEDVLDGPEDDVLNHWAKNRRFHLTLISFFDNEYIYRTLQNSLNVLTRAYAQFFWDKWHKTVFVSVAGGHRRFVDALEANDKESAIRWLAQDISGFDEFENKSVL